MGWPSQIRPTVRQHLFGAISVELTEFEAHFIQKWFSVTFEGHDNSEQVVETILYQEWENLSLSICLWLFRTIETSAGYCQCKRDDGEDFEWGARFNVLVRLNNLLQNEICSRLQSQVKKKYRIEFNLLDLDEDGNDQSNRVVTDSLPSRLLN